MIGLRASMHHGRAIACHPTDPHYFLSYVSGNALKGAFGWPGYPPRTGDRRFLMEVLKLVDNPYRVTGGRR